MAHGVHAVAAGPAAVPAPQGVHAVAPEVLAKVPAGQSLQLGLPGALAKWPAVQAVQADWPGADVVPARQAVQLAALSPA